jgi:hypothetical protein
MLYQTLDVKDKAWHGGKNNPQSIGIEIDSRAHANRFPDAYDKAHRDKYTVGAREKRIDYVGGEWIKGYQYNDKQYETLIRLGVMLSRLFPGLRQGPFGQPFAVDFPRHNGRIITSKLKKPKSHRGLICHYNTNSGKNDPIALDHYRLLRGLEFNAPTFGSTFLKAHFWKDKQEWLKAMGYYPLGPVDGQMSPETVGALKHFQANNGLKPDGIWGPKSDYMMDVVTKTRGIR